MPPGVDAPSNADGENAQLLAIGRFFGGFAGCSAAAIDVGGDDQAPAYVLTAGHCAGMDHWQPNEVFIGSSAEVLGLFRVNGFWDAVESPIEFPTAAIEYSTMHTTDVAIVRLGATVGDLRNQGITPFPIADELPPLASAITVVGHPLMGVMLRSRCNQGKSTRVVESEFLIADIANDCEGVTFGSSGSPAFDTAGGIFGVISTGSGTGYQCSENNPCDVDAPDKTPPFTIPYAAQVAGLRKCFAEGRFNLDSGGCILAGPPIPSATRGVGRYARSIVDGNITRWNVSIQDAGLPYYRFKSGPAASTLCDVDVDYGQVTSVAASPIITDELTPVEGIQVLCVHGGTSTDVSTAFTPISNAAAIIAEIDDTPPPTPLPVNPVSSDGTTASGISYYFGGWYPNYVKYYYRLQVAGASDCQKLPNDTVITSFTEVQFSIPTQPSELCVTAEDAAGNPSEPQVIPIDQPSAS